MEQHALATTTDHNARMEIEVTDEIKAGYRLREFTLQVTDDRIVTGVLWVPDDAPVGSPLVCAGHGASGDRFQAPLPWLAKELASKHNAFSLAIDGPVHGRRQSGPGGRDSFWPEWAREGTVEDMNADWIAALDWAQTQPEVGAGPVGYWGLSMGTIYGAPFVAADPRIVVTVLGLMGISGPDHYLPSIRSAAEAITIPTLFLMQLEDELFGREPCLELFDAIAATDKQLHANPGLHPEVPVRELVHSVEFLMQGLRP